MTADVWESGPAGAWDLCAHGLPLYALCPSCEGIDPVDPPEQGEPAAASPASGRGPGMATRLVAHARDHYTLGWAKDGSGPFAVAHGTHLALPLRGGRGSLRGGLARAAHDLWGQTPSAAALSDAMTTLEGYAEDSPASEVHLRVAHRDAALWLDLGDETGRVVKVARDGWQVLDHCAVTFRRSELTAALPAPERGGSLADLWRFANVRTDLRPVLVGWLVAVLLPDRPCPVAALTGEQGAGKSTATRLLGNLVDPSPAATRKPPKDIEAWVVAAAGSRVVAVDNLSGITDWFSDSLCRAVTGDADVRRTLYSDTGLTVFAFRRAIILNGIDLGAVRPDLGDRLVPIALDRIAEADRIAEEALPELWAAAWPRILGALLDLAAQVLHDLAAHPKPERLPRMADFGRVLTAVDRITGSNAAEAYAQLGDDLAGDTVATDPILAALVAVMRVPWEGSAGDLLALLDPHRPTPLGREWPRTGRGMTGHLTRHAPALRRLGWSVETFKDRHRKVILWRLTPPGQDAEQCAEVSPRQNRPTSAGPPPTPANLRTDEAGDEHDHPESAEVGGVAGVVALPTLLTLEEAHRLTHPVQTCGDSTPATPPTSAVDTGPCVLCRQPTRRYGDGGNPKCDRCRSASPLARRPPSTQEGAHDRHGGPEPRAPGGPSRRPVPQVLTS